MEKRVKIPGIDRNTFEEVNSIILNNDNFLLITHDFPDGDCLGSQVALYELLVLLGKNVSMLCSSDIPYQYKFLPHTDKIKKDINSAMLFCRDRDCVCFCLDSADEGRFNTDTGMLKEMVRTIINIDHHPGNTGYGDINIIDPQKSATAEIIYELVKFFFEDYLNYNIAIGIYTGILTDTGRFQYENTTHNAHRIVSHLLEFDLKPPVVFSYIYENEPFARFKLIEMVLKRIKLIKSKKLIYSYVLQKDFEKFKLPFSANDGIIELLRSASEANIAALFKQVGPDKFKVSLRSSESACSVAEIAGRFGGGGHKLAAAYSNGGSLKKVIDSLIEAINL